MKYEWKKKAKDLYLPKEHPEIITVPSMKFFTLHGQGNPNGDKFAEEVGVLYSLSYAVKMLPKKDITPPGYFEYTVFPLEGVWDLADEAKELDSLDKDKLIYTIMIRQPDFVTNDIALTAIEETKKKKHHQLYDKVKFESIEEGMCIQMMHVGSFDSEPESFAKMEEYCRTNNLKRLSLTHREIYITDARKTSQEKQKTVLRFKVGKV
ncbi:MAG: GyrI-like domain-containing protein [Dehalobacterium sp.]